MKLTITGKAGSGKSTVAKMLAQKLNLTRYYIGGMRRDAATKRGMTLEEFNAWAEANPTEGDKLFDDEQERIGKTQDNIILEGRVSYLLVPDSIKIFLSVDLDEAANRIWSDLKNRNEGTFKSVEDIKISLKKRKQSDLKRYEALYGIKEYDLTKFDIVIDTTGMTPEQVTDAICQIVMQ